MKKLIDRDPFSNGTELMRFETYNCDKCFKSIKSSKPIKNRLSFTNCNKDGLPKCSIQRDIVTRMFCNEPIKEATVKICNEFSLHGVLCPYMKTEYPKKKSNKIDKNQTQIEL